MKRNRYTLSLLLSSALLAGGLSAVWADDLNDQLQDIQGQINASQGQQQQAESVIQDVTAQLKQIQSELDAAAAQLKQIQTRVQTVNANIAQTTADLQAAQAKTSAAPENSESKNQNNLYAWTAELSGSDHGLPQFQ